MERGLQRQSLRVLPVLSSRPAYAEWVLIGSSAGNGGYTVFIDPETIRRKGDLVKMWHLYDFQTTQTNASRPFLSSKAQNQHDCAEERTRVLAYTWFSGNMGNGNVVFANSDELKWMPIAPGSIDEVLWKFACDKQ
jgi:hypothetical protein